MTDKKTSDEALAGPLTGSELVRIVQGGANAQSTTGAIGALSGGATGPAGPAGPTGPTGPAGPTGPTGPTPGGAIATMASTGFHTFTDPQGSATIIDTLGGIALSAPSEGGNNVIRSVGKVLPARPYAIIGQVALNPDWVSQPNDQWAGLAWRDNGASAAGKFIMSGIVHWGTTNEPCGLAANNFTNYNTYGGSGSSAGLMNISSQVVWFKLKDDGTNLIWSYSFDGGNFRVGFQVPAATSFFGGHPAMICFFVNAKQNPVSATLMHYNEYDQNSPYY